MKFLDKIAASLSDWADTYVHFSDTNKIGIHPQQFHIDLAGIYLFPSDFKTVGTIWKKKKYKFTVRLKPNLNILDLSKLKEDDFLAILNKLNIPKSYIDGKLNADNFWEVLKNYYVLSKRKQVGLWNKDFRRIGYDAIFDDTGSIHTAEVQLIVLDSKNIDIINVETQNIHSGSYSRLKEAMHHLEQALKRYGTVEVEALKKKRNELRGKVDLTLANGEYISWQITDDVLNQEISFVVSSTNNPKLRELKSRMTIYFRSKYDEITKIQIKVDDLLKQVNTPIAAVSKIQKLKSSSKK